MEPSTKIDETDGPMPVVLIDSGRQPFNQPCVNHRETPGVVFCSRCGRTLCAMCIQGDATEFLCIGSCPGTSRRRMLLWPVLAGALLLVLLGGVVMVQSNKKADSSVEVAAAVPVALPAVAPVIEEPAPPPVEPAPAEEPEAPPPPIVIEPAPPVVAVVPKAVEVLPEPVPAPAPAPAPPPPPAPLPVVLPPAPPPATPSPSPSPEELALERALNLAAGFIREAEPLFREVAALMDPIALENADLRTLGGKLEDLKVKLNAAKVLYAELGGDALDGEILGWRLAMLEELLEAVDGSLARIRVPRAMKEAAHLLQEAVPLYKEALAGFQEGSTEAQALEVKAEVADRKLREARARYLSIRADVPDPKLIDRRIQVLDGLLATLGDRFPAVSAK